MPTGYTCQVQDGMITEFKEFALLCARNFGACITLRDEPLSPDIPEFEVSTERNLWVRRLHEALDSGNDS